MVLKPLYRNGVAIFRGGVRVWWDGVSPCECCEGCCPNETMPATLDLAITGNGTCACFTRDVTITKIAAGVNEAWRYDTGPMDFTAACGGLDRQIQLWCQSTTEVTAEGWTLEEGKTYVLFSGGGGGCHRTDPVDPLDSDRNRPVEVTVLSCDPFHATVNVPLSDYSATDGDCTCSDSIDLEFTAP